MNTREQFGNYLLLKKLTEDPLGETFRAGMLGSKGMERVVLLRIFNGQGVDGGRLWQETRERAAIQQILRSPNIGEGVEMGELQGIPYVAYDYVSGRNMATLLETAGRKKNFIPAEHALLIAERVALALAVACENRHGGDRILHGFLVPHLVMISNEGETRVLGFEVGPGLRGFAGNPVIRQHFGRYLSPEAAAGQPIDRSDDIWSLGVLLFELLTSKPLPAASGGYASVIDGATLATEGTPIPPDLAQLLKQSLVSRDQRIKDVATWHKTLNKWMFDGQYNPTTFNLAFYMHNLFRQEIEKESQEIEVEKTMPVPTPPPAPAPAPAPTPAAGREPSASPEVSEATENFIPEYAKEDESSSKTGLIIGLVAVLAIAAIAGFFFLSGAGGGDAAEPTRQQAQATTPPVDQGPSAEEVAAQQQAELLQEQIRKLVEERSASMEEELRKQYDEQLAELETQLDTAKEAADQAAAERERKRREAAEAAKKAAEEEAARIAAEEAAEKAAEEEAARIAAEEEARIAAEEEAARIAAEEAKKPPVVTPPPPPPPPAEPEVRVGDLVKITDPGVVPPEMTRQPQPRFPAVARRMGRTNATVRIKVLVDENGDVVDTEIDEKAGFGFDAEAVQAARKAQFRPATKNGVRVKVWHTLSIQFRQ